MSKRAATKPTLATPPSGTTTTVRTNKDGTLMRKKSFWLEESLVQQFEVWCVTNRREPNEVPAEIFRSFVGKKA